MRTLFSLSILLAPSVAAANPTWLVSADAPVAVAVSEPQNDWFAAGALPSVGLARAMGPGFLTGARLRGGALGEGASPEGGLADKDVGGLCSLTALTRLRPGGSTRLGAGLWIEAAAGAALTGRDVRATAELGLGWGFAAGPVVLGPSLRYLHVFQPDGEASPHDAQLGLLGIEVALSGSPDEERLVVTRAASPHRAPRAVAEAAPSDVDRDLILDVDDACPQLAEVENGVEDRDGCPDEGLFVVVEDRITLGDQVLFRTDRARVSRRGREVLAAIAGYLAEHPEFALVEVEGHADERGTEEYNLELSRLRGERVRDVLVGLGVRAAVTITARGESSPRAGGDNERAWRQNRRVEFVLVRRQPRTAEVSR
jgi:outer membrane protein OmpA-like peptidoglycan-associated protein